MATDAVAANPETKAVREWSQLVAGRPHPLPHAARTHYILLAMRRCKADDYTLEREFNPMKSNLITSIGCALAICLAATSVHAQHMGDPSTPPPEHGGDHPHGGGGRGFDAMDADHDGFVTMDEWKAAGRRPERFAQIDTDHDGKITREEMHTFMEKMRAEHPRNGEGPGGAPGGGIQPPPQ